MENIDGKIHFSPNGFDIFLLMVHGTLENSKKLMNALEKSKGSDSAILDAQGMMCIAMLSFLEAIQKISNPSLTFIKNLPIEGCQKKRDGFFDRITPHIKNINDNIGYYESLAKSLEMQYEIIHNMKFDKADAMVTCTIPK